MHVIGTTQELGPFGIGPKLDIEPRAVSWNNDAHLLALDNPLGVGYSHTSSLARMATNQTTVGADLYEAIAAGGPHTGIRAVIGVVHIAIVTGLTEVCIDDSVSTK